MRLTHRPVKAVHLGTRLRDDGRLAFGLAGAPVSFGGAQEALVEGVCGKPCNNDKMSQLEKKAAALLRPAMLHGWTEDLREGSAELLLRWIIKTAFFWMRLVPSRRWDIPIEHVRSAICDGRAPDGCFLILGVSRAHSSSFWVDVSDQFPIASESSENPGALFRVASLSYRATFHFAGAMLSMLYLPPDSGYVPALLPSLHKLAWPPRSRYVVPEWNGFRPESLVHQNLAHAVAIGVADHSWRSLRVPGPHLLRHVEDFNGHYQRMMKGTMGVVDHL